MLTHRFKFTVTLLFLLALALGLARGTTGYAIDHAQDGQGISWLDEADENEPCDGEPCLLPVALTIEPTPSRLQAGEPIICAVRSLNSPPALPPPITL